MINDIHISFTYNSEDNSLKVQATNNSVTPHQLKAFLRTLVEKVILEEFMKEDDGSYMEETFKLEQE